MSSFFRSVIGAIRKGFSRARGQSLVEIAIALPVLLLLLSGMIEVGFMLNYYLSLLDSTREAARLYSNFDPFLRDEDHNPIGDNLIFYQGVAEEVLRTLQPANELDTSRKIRLIPASDDVVVSVFSVDGTHVVRFPSSTGGEYHKFNNQPSDFSNAEIISRLIGTAPPTGILLVEVYYAYHQVLALPWITIVIPNPTMLHAYTMMPLSAAEPTPIPSSP
jgi:hypothetical protein